MELDHVFACCSVGAPEADRLVRAGLREGSPNTHPGQGTACRRFFFDNAYLELFWVSDPQEAQSEEVRPTRLWDRWSGRGGAACPFAVVLRPGAGDAGSVPPFPTWAYRPSYMPPGLAIEIACDTPLAEPGFFFLGFQPDRARRGQDPATHDLPASELTGVRISGPLPGPRSQAAAAVQAAGLLLLDQADQYLMELTFDGARHAAAADLRPDLPLILCW